MTNENIRSLGQYLSAACAVFGGVHLISHLFPKPDPDNSEQRSTLRGRVSVYVDYIRPTTALKPASSVLIFTAGLAAIFLFSRKSATIAMRISPTDMDAAPAQPTGSTPNREETLELLSGQSRSYFAWRDSNNTDTIDQLREAAIEHRSNALEETHQAAREALNTNFGNAVEHVGNMMSEWIQGRTCDAEANGLEYMPDNDWYRDHGVER